jgi:hypothetical protein
MSAVTENTQELEPMESEAFDSHKSKAAEVLHGILAKVRDAESKLDALYVSFGRFANGERPFWKAQTVKYEVFVEWLMAESGRGRSWCVNAMTTAEVIDSLPSDSPYRLSPQEDLLAVAKVPNGDERHKLLAKVATTKATKDLTGRDRTKAVKAAAQAVVAKSDPDKAAKTAESAEKRERAKTDTAVAECRPMIEPELVSVLTSLGDNAANIAKVLRYGVLIGVNHGIAGLSAFDAIVTDFLSPQAEARRNS